MPGAPDQRTDRRSLELAPTKASDLTLTPGGTVAGGQLFIHCGTGWVAGVEWHRAGVPNRSAPCSRSCRNPCDLGGGNRLDFVSRPFELISIPSKTASVDETA